MPWGISTPPSAPNLHDIVKELKVERFCIGHVLLSQHVHGTHHAGQLPSGAWKREMLREEISPGTWATGIRVEWWSLYSAAHRLLEVAVVLTDELVEPVARVRKKRS